MRNIKGLICAVLGATLLAAPAQAVPLASSSPSGGDRYTVEGHHLPPVYTWGTLASLEDGRFLLENSSSASSLPSVFVTVGEDTLILDAVTGQEKTFADLKLHETLYAYLGPAMALSMPPIANAELILCNLPAGFGAPAYAEVQHAASGEDGNLSVLLDSDIVLHLDQDTQLLPAPGRENVSAGQIQPGARLLSWYGMVAESFPAQAWPDKVMVFPSQYTAWMSASTNELVLDGKSLILSAAQQPLALDGKLMLPLRPVAEALGCTVSWDSANPSRISVERAGQVSYEVDLALGTFTVEGDMVFEATHKPVTINGITFLAAEDLIARHGLKWASNQPGLCGYPLAPSP